MSSYHAFDCRQNNMITHNVHTHEDKWQGDKWLSIHTNHHGKAVVLFTPPLDRSSGEIDQGRIYTNIRVPYCTGSHATRGSKELKNLKYKLTSRLLVIRVLLNKKSKIAACSPIHLLGFEKPTKHLCLRHEPKRSYQTTGKDRERTVM